MTSTFDPILFLEATTTEALTKRAPLPAGTDFVGTIGEPKPRQWQGKVDPTKSGVVVDVPITIDLTATPDVAKATGADRVTLTDGIMLDTKEGAGGLIGIDWGKGKNGKLRRYREALNINTPGQEFNLNMMSGRLIRVKISHREYEGEIFDQVDSVAKA